MTTLPNLVYIGPDKAGSTWLFHLLTHHEDVYVTPAKDLYFFDRFFDNGLDWYSRQFETGSGHEVIAEVSHDYLYSMSAAARMADLLSDATLMVCLREPVERAFSAYLHLVKCGHFSGTFEQALEKYPDLVNRGLYGKHLSMFLDYFPREQFICAEFDGLQRNPQQFASQIFANLGLSDINLPEELSAKALPAGRSRCAMLTRSVRMVANLVRNAGMPKLVGQVKTSKLVQAILFSQYTNENKPQLATATRERLRDAFASDVRLLDDVMGTSLSERWGYEPISTPTPTTTNASFRPVHAVAV